MTGVALPFLFQVTFREIHSKSRLESLRIDGEELALNRSSIPFGVNQIAERYWSRSRTGGVLGKMRSGRDLTSAGVPLSHSF